MHFKSPNSMQRTAPLTVRITDTLIPAKAKASSMTELGAEGKALCHGRTSVL